MTRHYRATLAIYEPRSRIPRARYLMRVSGLATTKFRRPVFQHARAPFETLNAGARQRDASGRCIVRNKKQTEQPPLADSLNVPGEVETFARVTRSRMRSRKNPDAITRGLASRGRRIIELNPSNARDLFPPLWKRAVAFDIHTWPS